MSQSVQSIQKCQKWPESAQSCRTSKNSIIKFFLGHPVLTGLSTRGDDASKLRMDQLFRRNFCVLRCCPQREHVFLTSKDCLLTISSKTVLFVTAWLQAVCQLLYLFQITHPEHVVNFIIFPAVEK